MHSEGYSSSCPVCVSVHSSGTHATKLLTSSTPMDRVSCSLQNLFGVYCSVAKLEHFLAKSVNHFVYMYVKRTILHTTLPERKGLAL